MIKIEINMKCEILISSQHLIHILPAKHENIFQIKRFILLYRNDLESSNIPFTSDTAVIYDATVLFDLFLLSTTESDFTIGESSNSNSHLKVFLHRMK
uniref:NR LBD domain-containing protein n=1 Tax=Caenorhabditis tropicalis TaxID=1561998 RepID=A0A1I7U4B2_9PELO